MKKLHNMLDFARIITKILSLVFGSSRNLFELKNNPARPTPTRIMLKPTFNCFGIHVVPPFNNQPTPFGIA